MSEEILENQNNLEEVVQEDVPQQEDVQVQEQVEETVKAEPIKSNENEENLRALRESRRKLKQEKEALELKLKQIEDAKNKPEEDFDYEDDTTKELKQIKQYIAQNEGNNQRLKLQTKYQDFNSVVNEESIAVLQERFPEVAQTLDQGKDIYSTGVSAYNIIKKFGLHLNDDQITQKAHVQQNMSKPIPSSAIKSSSPLSHASDYSDLENKEVRNAILKQSMEYSKNI